MIRCNILQNDTKTKEELIDNVIIQKASYSDASEIIRIMHDCFNIPSQQEALRQLLYSKADLDNSIKVIDKRDNKIYGLLIFSDFSIINGSPIIHNPTTRPIGEYLSYFKQLNGFSFILDERLRGTNLDKQMLFFNMDYINQYDYIWCGVEQDLKSHNYWQRLGFVELFSIDEAKFYIKGISKKNMNDIFILKMLCEKNIDYEDNYY